MTAHDPSRPSDFTDYDYGLGLIPVPTSGHFDPENLRTLAEALAAELRYIRFPA